MISFPSHFLFIILALFLPVKCLFFIISYTQNTWITSRAIPAFLTMPVSEEWNRTRFSESPEALRLPVTDLHRQIDWGLFVPVYPWIGIQNHLRMTSVDYIQKLSYTNRLPDVGARADTDHRGRKRLRYGKHQLFQEVTDYTPLQHRHNWQDRSKK